MSRVRIFLPLPRNRLISGEIGRFSYISRTCVPAPTRKCDPNCLSGVVGCEPFRLVQHQKIIKAAEAFVPLPLCFFLCNCSSLCFQSGSFFTPSQFKTLGDSAEARCVLFDVVHLRGFRRRVPEQICNLSRHQRADRTIRLPDAVDEVRGKGVQQ